MVPAAHPRAALVFRERRQEGTSVSLQRLGEWGEERKTSTRFLLRFRKVFSKTHPLFPSHRLYLVLSSLGCYIDSSLPLPLQLIRSGLTLLLSLIV